MKFGEKISGLRKRKKLRQQEFADLLNVHVNTLSHWENLQEPIKDYSKIQKLAKALDTTPEYLLSTDDEEAQESGNERKYYGSDHLVYEWEGNRKLILPNTPETRSLFLELVSQAIGGKNISAPTAV